VSKRKERPWRAVGKETVLLENRRFVLKTITHTHTDRKKRKNQARWRLDRIKVGKKNDFPRKKEPETCTPTGGRTGRKAAQSAATVSQEARRITGDGARESHETQGGKSKETAGRNENPITGLKCRNAENIGKEHVKNIMGGTPTKKKGKPNG